MTLNLTHTQTRTMAGTAYRVADTVSAATDMPTAVFVFRTEGSLFSRVGTVEDLLTYPESHLTAVTTGSDYYRLSGVQKDFTALSDAIEFGVALEESLKSLVVEYNKAVSGFIGTTTETLTP